MAILSSSGRLPKVRTGIEKQSIPNISIAHVSRKESRLVCCHVGIEERTKLTGVRIPVLASSLPFHTGSYLIYEGLYK